MWQDLDPVGFLWDFRDRIYHVDCKDAKRQVGNGRNGRLGSHLAWADPRRGWDFVSTGHGDVPWEACFRMLNTIGYDGPDLGRVGGRRHGPAGRRARGAGVRPAARLRPADGLLRRGVLQQLANVRAALAGVRGWTVDRAGCRHRAGAGRLRCNARRRCTSIGCSSEVAVTDLTQVASVYGPQPVRPPCASTVTARPTRSSSRVATATPTVDKVLGENSPPAKTDVGVTFRLTRDGKTLLDTSTTTQLTRSQPNGKNCGPICYQSTFTIAGGKLVPGVLTA